jgi:uncharacterized protein HemX
VETGEVTYLVISVEKIGSVLLLEGEKKEVPTSGDTAKEPKKKSGAVWMWVLIALVSVLSVGAVVFTIWWTKKNKTSSSENKKVSVKKESEKSAPAEKKPLPIEPEEKNPIDQPERKEEMEATRVLGAVQAQPELKEEKKAVPAEAKAAEEPSGTPKTISFEDLED